MERLHKLALFASLNPQTIESLTRDLPTKDFKQGQTLMRQGEKNLQAFVLLEGKVGVYAESKEGLKTAIIFHEAPYFIGIIELWQEKPYLGTVTAIEPCSTLVVSKKNYLKMLQSSHQLSINLVQMLSNLLYQTARDRRVRIFGKVEHLLAHTLCSLAELYGEEHRYGILVRKEINKSELAGILGVARRSVIRAMSTLETENLIRLDGKQLIIPDLIALRRKATAPIS